MQYGALCVHGVKGFAWDKDTTVVVQYIGSKDQNHANMFHITEVSQLSRGVGTLPTQIQELSALHASLHTLGDVDF